MSALGVEVLDRTGQPLPVAELHELWPLGGWRSLERVPGGKNEHYRVHAGDGVFFLRRSHRGKSHEELVVQLDLMRLLRDRGLPVPLPVPTGSGADHALLDGRFWTLTREIPGERYDETSAAHLRQFGRTLARYHDLTEDVDAGHGEPGLLTDLRARLEPGELPPSIVARGHRLVQRLTELAPDLPRAFVHGGARRGSLLFRDDRVIGVLDFDSAHGDVRVLDLAVAVHDVGKVYTDPAAADHKVRMDLNRVHDLLLAYTETRSLRPSEAAALPLLLEAKRVKRALGRLHRDHVGEPLSVNDHGKIELENQRLAWLDEHRDTLAELCGSFVTTGRV
jgi:homoserine kinase type II